MAGELPEQLANGDEMLIRLTRLLCQPNVKAVLSMPRPFSRLKAINIALMAIKRAVHDQNISVMPTNLILSNTQTCNLRCPFCGSHGTEEMHIQYNGRDNDLDFIFADRICQEVLPYVDKVWLSLVGEGLNVKTEEIREYCRLFLRYGNHLSLYTNGMLLDQSRVAALLPVCRHLAFSLDGASPLVFEAIRLNARFDKVLWNIKRLTLACEYLPQEIRPDFQIKITICGSNVHELPDMIKMSKLLGIKNVNGNFIVVPQGYNHIAREDMTYHKGRYNYWRRLAMEVAGQEGVTVNLTPPFPEVADESGIPEKRDLMIVSEIPLPTDISDNAIWDQLQELDVEALALACEVVNNLKKAHEEQLFVESGQLAAELEQESHKALARALRRNKTTLRAMVKSPDETQQDCWYLDRYLDVRNDGNSRMCCNGAMQFDILRAGQSLDFRENVEAENSNLRADGASVRKVFNGPVHSWISRQITAGSPPYWCLNCDAMVRRPNGEFMAELLGCGAVRQNKFGRLMSVTSNSWLELLKGFFQ